MLTLQLSEQATEDLTVIADFTLAEFGEYQAYTYYQQLLKVFDLLCMQPLLGKDCSNIRSGVRRLVHRSHGIYYRVNGDALLILRILSHWQDPLTKLQ
ncbi:type II toxin-antitoxin system RelE/ParE family toxin [Chromatiaceae bacterium AAb-1]|nr:type II toxin-antitoxin system RelE/ParE family toxin [Chromatiaceae bacterium AAb-1]